MKVSVYNQTGKEVGTTLLPKDIFEVPINYDLVHQIIQSQIANRRQNVAKTKDRAEVRGGGKKPWRQKGTGRARHGSIRSPLWKGGGVTFGPTGKKVLTKKVPKKMKRKALFMALSAKAREGMILVLDDLKIPRSPTATGMAANGLAIEKPKTKIMAGILKKLFLNKGTGLIVLPKKNDITLKSTRNIPGTKTITAKDLNALDLLSYKYLVMPKESIKIIKGTFYN